MQRYDFDELTKHECDDGEWVKASEAEAEIQRLRKALGFIGEQAELFDLHGIKRQCLEALEGKNTV